MKILINTVSQAFQALCAHGLRTLLSILGVTVGISAVMVVSTISRGGNHMVFAELETFGLNSVWISRDWNDESSLRQLHYGSGISTDDLSILKERSHSLRIRQITPLVFLNASYRQVHRGDKLLQANIIGVGDEYENIVNDTIALGRGFMRHDIEQRQPVAVLAPMIAHRLFDTGEEPVGKVIYIGSQRFVVIGVLATKSREFLSSIGSSGGQDANLRVLIPYPNAQRALGNNLVGSLQIEVQNLEEAEEVGIQVKRILERRNKGYKYKYETMAGYIATTNRILGGVSVVGIVAASVSLLVGGMGIMNMMGTSVLERTREIGVRKAVGAREKDILTQFLLEAGLISVAGGFFGLVFGGITCVALTLLTGIPLFPAYDAILGALVVSVLVGGLSGFLPARKAALLHPVVALRSN